MLAKLRMALILFIIGSLSGLSIVGVHRLTEDAIAHNELMQQYDDYVAIFPDIDLSDLQEEDIDEDIIQRRIDAYDQNGDLLGYIFVGRAQGHSGMNTILVGVDPSADIVKVVISATDDTPNYAQIIIDDYLPNLSNQRIDEVDYDTSTGATNTYNSVRTVIDAASLHVAGDPAMEAYLSVFDDAERYATNFVFDDEALEEEINIFNAADEIIGYAYIAFIDDESVYIIFDTDDVYQATVSQDVDTSVYDDDIGTKIADIEPEDDDLGLILAELKDLLTNSTRVSLEYIARYFELYDDEDSHIGYTYVGIADGFGGLNVIDIHINLDGELIEYEVVRSNDTPDYINPVLENFEQFIGDSSLSEDDALADDVTVGATRSATSIYNIINAAFEAHAEREGE